MWKVDPSQIVTADEKQEERRRSQGAAVQAYLNAKAQELGYDSIESAISYRGDRNARFSAEADALFAWRSAVWTWLSSQDDMCDEALISALPPFERPI